MLGKIILIFSNLPNYLDHFLVYYSLKNQPRPLGCLGPCHLFSISKYRLLYLRTESSEKKLFENLALFFFLRWQGWKLYLLYILCFNKSTILLILPLFIVDNNSFIWPLLQYAHFFCVVFQFYVFLGAFHNGTLDKAVSKVLQHFLYT